MLVFELEKLIKSLSATERKLFHLHSSKLQGPKDYVLLFDLATDKKAGRNKTWEQRFKEKYPNKLFENAANYLYKVLTDVLVQIRIEQDTWYTQYQSLMKARLCFERSIPNRAHKELQKTLKLAAESQNHSVAYQAARMELTALADIGFPSFNEQQLVDKQMKAKHTLQSLRQLHEHYSLYELLSHRLTKGVLHSNGKRDKRINDLILSELSLTTRGSQYQFEPQKLHLLFQSFFFIHTGEYRSALRIFDELNTFIESNESMWNYPPYDYLSALDGILDSLRGIGYYREMAHFIDKIVALSKRTYPDHFRSLAGLTALAYRLSMYLGTGDVHEAMQLLDSSKHEKQQTSITDSHEKQLEYLYFEGLAYFLSQQWHDANRCINHFFTFGKQNSQLSVYRAGRLLHILLGYEQDDMAYLEYEIRSYKRAFSKLGKAFKIEKLVFNTIAADPKRRGNAWKAAARQKVAIKLSEIRSDKREMQLLKFFDYGKWVLSKYT
ncbi:hypothetical protein [Parapedobacter koreensis]|uniref:RNA polymerase I-associated factor PAF67 n=1 Tax=Parapedobacter koreensis TaxID=332977 RepID=A0A1H7TIX6_9SPHI|nr:hypothetical protein [Parapedobacter koreensis]SEL84515.1 RNA polymerase I-associated factor PAF67 [Parapedobacter koreensis]